MEDESLRRRSRSHIGCVTEDTRAVRHGGERCHPPRITCGPHRPPLGALSRPTSPRSRRAPPRSSRCGFQPPSTAPESSTEESSSPLFGSTSPMLPELRGDRINQTSRGGKRNGSQRRSDQPLARSRCPIFQSHRAQPRRSRTLQARGLSDEELDNGWELEVDPILLTKMGES